MSAPDGRAPAGLARPVSVRSLADIARAGFSMVRQPTMRVAYEVHHVADRPGYLYEVLKSRQSTDPGKAPDGTGAPDQPEPERFIESLTTAAHGAGLVIGTRTVSGAPVASSPPGATNPVFVSRVPRVARQFSSSAVPNVSFVHDSTYVFEGLIAIGARDAPLQTQHGRAVLDVMDKVAELAADIAHGPILSLQSPVQLPHRPGRSSDDDDRDEFLQDAKPRGWPRVSAVAVRFTIALPEPSAALRLRLMDAASTFCDENGFALWVGDARSGFRAGNWFSVCPHNPKRLDEYFEHSVGAGGDAPPVRSLPVTFVGPARVGAVKSIVRYLRHYAPVGVIACSMSIMDDVTFIHLQLTSEAIRNGDATAVARKLDEAVAGAGQPLRPQQVEPLKLLPKLLEHLVGTAIDAPPNGLVTDLTRKVGDFHLLSGPARTIPSNLPGIRRALWVAWEVEGREAELSVPFLALYEALQTLMPWVDEKQKPDGPNVEYLICRRVRHALLRGKGKISFPNRIRPMIAKDDLQAGLTEFSERIEEAWRAKLGPRHRVRELTVSWRENWLGHWTSSLD